jgi:hypothetical protein
MDAVADGGPDSRTVCGPETDIIGGRDEPAAIDADYAGHVVGPLQGGLQRPQKGIGHPGPLPSPEPLGRLRQTSGATDPRRSPTVAMRLDHQPPSRRNCPPLWCWAVHGHDERPLQVWLAAATSFPLRAQLAIDRVVVIKMSDLGSNGTEALM